MAGSFEVISAFSFNQDIRHMICLLDEYAVDENQSERDDEEDVGEVENKLGDKLLRAIPFHIPVCYPNLQKRNE